MWLRVILKQDDLPSSLTGVKPFLLQCVTNTNQLLLITLNSDRFTGLEQFVMNDALLISLYTQQHLLGVDIRFCGTRRLSRINP